MVVGADGEVAGLHDVVINTNTENRRYGAYISYLGQESDIVSWDVGHDNQVSQQARRTNVCA